MTNKPFVTRRSFFQRLLGRGQTGACMFALQIVFDCGPREELYEELRAIVGSFGAESVDELRRYYKRLARALREAAPVYEYAFFEYVTDPEETEPSFDHWVTEIEDAMASEEHDPYPPFEVDRYVAITVLLLLDHPHPMHGRDMSEDYIYTREGLIELVDSLNRIDYAGIIANAAFMLPQEEHAGMAREHLDDEGWAYLHPILI